MHNNSKQLLVPYVAKKDYESFYSFNENQNFLSYKKKNYNGHQNAQGNPVLVVFLECVYIYFCERYFLPNYCREHNYYSVTTLSRSEESKWRERERERGTFLEYRKSGANYCNRKRL